MTNDELRNAYRRLVEAGGYHVNYEVYNYNHNYTIGRPPQESDTIEIFNPLPSVVHIDTSHLSRIEFCRMCGNRPTNREVTGNRLLCQTCYTAHIADCIFCESNVITNYDTHYVTTHGELMCNTCYEDSDMNTCVYCNRATDEGSWEDDAFYCYRHQEDLDEQEDLNYDAVTTYITETNGRTIPATRKFGVEIEVIAKKQFRHLLPNGVGVVHDGSLNTNGAEIVTPPMKGIGGEKLIKEICTVLNGRSKIDTSCGLHVHIEAKDFKEDRILLKELLQGYILIEDILLGVVPKSRRGNRYAKLLKNDFSLDRVRNFESVEDLEMDYYKAKNHAEKERFKQEHYHDARYFGINFHSLFSDRGTLEVRLHQGTISHEKILKWALLHISFIDYIKRSSNNTEKLQELQRMVEFKQKSNYLCDLLELKSPMKRYLLSRYNQLK